MELCDNKMPHLSGVVDCCEAAFAVGIAGDCCCCRNRQLLSVGLLCRSRITMTISATASVEVCG